MQPGAPRAVWYQIDDKLDVFCLAMLRRSVAGRRFEERRKSRDT
jgi:hypothetical protein